MKVIFTFFGTALSTKTNSVKSLYLHDRKVLQYCKSIFLVMNNTRKPQYTLTLSKNLTSSHLIVTKYHAKSYTRRSTS